MRASRQILRGLLLIFCMLGGALAGAIVGPILLERGTSHFGDPGVLLVCTVFGAACGFAAFLWQVPRAK